VTSQAPTHADIVAARWPHVRIVYEPTRLLGSYREKTNMSSRTL
jgi:hypothetical protein